jgi:hypothetical protein
MPTVYRSGARIPELKGRVRRGMALVVHSPGEVNGLRALVTAAADLPGDPLANAYRAVTRAGASALAAWPGWDEEAPAPTPEGPVEDPVTRALAALSLAGDLWREQGADVGELALAFALPRPRRRRPPRLEPGRPALVLDSGSVRARVLDVPGRFREFAVALFPVARSRRQGNLVEALRARAVEAGGTALPRLEGLTAADLAGKNAVLVFVHGLLSTDAGTFDGLVGRLRKDRAVGDGLLLVGWPHDTLARIDDNAVELAELIATKLGSSGLPVAFVCHSRGGLVARACAVELAEVSGIWRERLRGCVTFGTPHDGAELAELADEMLGKLLVLGTIARGGRAVPLVDALWVIHNRKKLKGITDLRPRRGGGKFLRRLARSEARLAGEAGGRVLPLLAVGGKVTPAGMKGWLSNRFLGGAPNDLVVPLSSSAPARFAPVHETPCDHFSYCSDGNDARVTRAIEFLKAVLALPAAGQTATRPP